jgi:DNA repair exonuclease SbcCD ATPase subunit
MELEVRQRFTAIEAVLQSIAESQKAAAARTAARMDEFEIRMERSDARMDRAEVRVDKMEARLDKRMDAIGKLIQTGMRMIVRIEGNQDKTELKMREVGEKLDALIMVVDGLVKRPGPNPR